MAPRMVRTWCVFAVLVAAQLFGAAASRRQANLVEPDTVGSGERYSSNITDKTLKLITDQLLQLDSGIRGTIRIYPENCNSGNSRRYTARRLIDANMTAIRTANPNVDRLLNLFQCYDEFPRRCTSSELRVRQNKLLEGILDTAVLQAALGHLANMGERIGDRQQQMQRLRGLWFQTYYRKKADGNSSGFQHMFMAEILQKGGESYVGGLHNWVFFEREEAREHLVCRKMNDFEPLTQRPEGNVYFFCGKYLWNKLEKTCGSFFIGSTPELEMALALVAYYNRRGKNNGCPLFLNGRLEIESYSWKLARDNLTISSSIVKKRATPVSRRHLFLF